MPQRRQATTLNRRTLLGLGAAAGLVGASAGCQFQVEPTQQQSGEAAAIDFPDSAGPLPDGEVTVTWMSNGPGPNTRFFNTLFAAYQAKHPGIKITYHELTNKKIREVLPLQLRNNNADDVFHPQGVPISELVRTSKIAALDDVVPSFSDWKSSLSDWVKIPGFDDFDGKMYGYRPGTDRRMSQMVLFNTEIMEKAGYDPVGQPFTLETFREAAKKITQQGDGTIFGLMTVGLAKPEEVVTENGGPPPFDWKTGTYQYTDDMYVSVIEFLKAIIDDGSVFPGWASLGDQEARGQFPLGRAGMILNGPWNFPVWKADFPDFSYGVAKPPAPTDHGYRYGSVGGNGYVVYIDAPDDHKLVAGDLLHFLGTEPGQEAWAKLVGSASPAWSQSALEKARNSPDLDEHDKTAYAMYDEFVRYEPAPEVGNPDVQKVRLAQKAVKPNFKDIVQGYLTGQITNLERSLRKLNDDSEKALDSAIATAVKAGAQVSRDDWVFSNWDPSQDYAASDYAKR